MFGSRTMALTAGSVLLLASYAAGQRRAAPLPASEEEKVGVAIAMQVAGAPFQAAGKGTCTHEARGSIYGTPAQQWAIEFEEGRLSFHLTFWRPANGAPDMFSLLASTGANSHSVSTTKGPAGGNVQGSGLVKLAAAASGGTFAIDATTTSGGRISGSVSCDAFTAAVAVGGE